MTLTAADLEALAEVYEETAKSSAANARLMRRLADEARTRETGERQDKRAHLALVPLEAVRARRNRSAAAVACPESGGAA